MKLYGLTGGVGSGKSTVAAFIEQLGIPVLYADVVARDLVQKGQPALEHIIAHFGNDYLLAHGELNRAKLRQRIFNHAQDKQWLETLLHPLIKQALFEKIKHINSAVCVLEIPLLFETRLDELVDEIIYIDCPQDIAIQRIVARDHCSPKTAEKMVNSQLPREEKIKRAHMVIDNSHSKEALLLGCKTKLLGLHKC